MPLPPLRHDWAVAEIEDLLALPFNDLLFRAQGVHRANFEATFDFRRLLATVLDDYWNVDSTKILGQKYASLGIF